jgi:hypothetical protein
MKIQTKLIKPLLLFFVVFIALGCGDSTEIEQDEKIVKNEGMVLIENGRGINDTIPYKCSGCIENLTYDMFQKVKEESTKIAKNNLNNPLSFKPLSMDIFIAKKDSLYYFNSNQIIDSVLYVWTDYKYIGQNAYGTELSGEQKISFTIVKGLVLDITEDIKLSDLTFTENGFCNRDLSGYRDEDFIILKPIKKNGTIFLIVESSLNCVDKGTVLGIELINGEKINVNSWNDFNCDGTSYFNYFSKSQLNQLKNSGVKYLYIYDRGKTKLVEIPKNESDYFIQLINLENSK